MKFIFTLVLSIFIMHLHAQDYVDLAKMHYANTPVNQFDTTTNGTRVQELGLDLTLPFVLKNGNAIITGLYAESISTKVSPHLSNLSSVYTTNLKLGMNFKYGEKWEGTYVLLPKLSSDFKAIGKQDFQFGAFALFKYKKHDNFKYKFGMYYNGELFGPFFVPILGLYYRSPNKKFETNLALPISADANYAFNDWFRAGMNFFAFVRTYHLNEPYQGNPDNYLAKTTNEIYGYLQFHIKKSILLQTKVGYSIGRNYRVYDTKDKITWGLSAFKFGDDRKQLNADFSDGLIFRVKLIYRYHLD
jgi:hypothetical protein